MVDFASGRFYIQEPAMDPWLFCRAMLRRCPAATPGLPRVFCKCSAARREILLFAFCLGLLCPTHGAEALLKLVDTSLCINELLLTGEERMRVSGDAD